MQVLKFVLWTWPSATASVTDFVGHRVAFHKILAESKVDGYLASGVFKVDAAPWGGSFLFENSPWSVGHKTVFEEWYLFHGSAALDAVNERVHAGPYKEGHGKFLREDLGGECAGLYYARKGTLESAVRRMQTARTLWFNKHYPTYDEMIGRVVTESDSVLWRRLLVLGPTHEFHIDVGADVKLPQELRAFEVRRTLVTPDSPVSSTS